MPSFQSGKHGKITINADDFHTTSWSATLNADALEVTNTGSSGNREYISGLSGGSGSFESHYDNDDPILAKVTNIRRGVQATGVFFIGDPVNAKSISGTIQLTEVEISSNVDGSVDVSASFNFSGAITEPTP